MSFVDTFVFSEKGDSKEVVIPEGWGQGRATFGGLISAIMFQLIGNRVAEERPVQSITTTFIAPISSGLMKVEIEELRSGKAVSQIEIKAYQNDVRCTHMVVSFGELRQSDVSVGYAPTETYNAPDKYSQFPFISGVTPDFTQHFDYRYAIGKFPFMGSDDPNLGGWIRAKTPSNSAISLGQLLAIVDAWPPACLTMLKKPAMASTLSWTVNVVSVPKGKTANDWWKYKASIQHSANGYSHIDSALWDDEDRLSILSRQTVCLFG